MTDETDRIIAGLSEVVAELQLAAFLAGRGSVTSMKHGTRSAKPAPSMDDFRAMADRAILAVRKRLQEMDDLVTEARLDAKAFRENTVYDSDGQAIRLGANADRLDKYANRIEALEAELAHVTEDRDLWKYSEATCNAQYDKLDAELSEARAECLEQARIIGAGGERELTLRAENATAYAKGRADERDENYKMFTDGMEAAAQICGSLAETTYDDADAFEAATGCEASIMAVVKEKRKECADNVEWEGPLTAEEQAMIDAAWEKHKAAAPPATQADDALVTDIAPLLDGVFGEPCSYELAGKIYRAILPILHRERAAAHTAGRAEERAEETGWLIENADEPKWLTLRPGEACFEVCWTKASLEALRFVRRTDAEDYVSTYFGGDGPIRITEHRWG
jgi:hypothetical protein